MGSSSDPLFPGDGQDTPVVWDPSWDPLGSVGLFLKQTAQIGCKYGGSTMGSERSTAGMGWDGLGWAGLVEGAGRKAWSSFPNWWTGGRHVAGDLVVSFFTFLGVRFHGSLTNRREGNCNHCIRGSLFRHQKYFHLLNFARVESCSHSLSPLVSHLEPAHVKME